jgi:hypothetical protein
MTWALILFLTLAAGALFLLPLLPSLREIAGKSDARAIAVLREETVDTRHFAHRFLALVEDSLGPTLDAVHRAGRSVFTELVPDQKALIVPGRYVHREGQRLGGMFSRVMAAAGDLQLADGVEYLSEVFARGDLIVGVKSRVRAAYAQRNLTLGRDTAVDRWIHAGAQLMVETGAVIYGRGSADEVILLSARCGFARLRAPAIEIGARDFEEGWRPSRATVEPVDWSALAPQADHGCGRVLIRGDLDLPPFHRVEESLVVHGDLCVRKGVWIHGSVKVHGEVTLEEGVRIDGSLISHGGATLSTGSKIAGPLLSERNLRIGRRCKIGDVLRPTTVRAQRIRIGLGSTVHGVLWASLKGEVDS